MTLQLLFYPPPKKNKQEFIACTQEAKPWIYVSERQIPDECWEKIPNIKSN